jgi:hypothetical protein
MSAKGLPFFSRCILRLAYDFTSLVNAKARSTIFQAFHAFSTNCGASIPEMISLSLTDFILGTGHLRKCIRVEYFSLY